MSTTATAKKPAAPKFNTSQTSVLKNLASSGPTTDYRSIIKDGGNGKTIGTLEDKGFIKTGPVSKKDPTKSYALTATGKKAASKL